MTETTDRIPNLALRVDEAAAALSISRSKMYGLLQQGKVKSVKVGEVMRVRLRDLETFLDEAQGEITPDIGS